MKKLSILLFSITLLLPLIAMVGCETESSDQIAISVTPSSVSLRKGESQTFTASGWNNYSWEISDTDAGTLSTKRGNSTTYTAVTSLSSSNSVQVLTVSAEVSASGTSNGAPTTVTAEALITHL